MGWDNSKQPTNLASSDYASQTDDPGLCIHGSSQTRPDGVSPGDDLSLCHDGGHHLGREREREINSTLGLDIKVDRHYRALSISYPPEAC